MDIDSPRPRVPAWVSLPAEIRYMILTEIALQKLPGWGILASVSKEWQSVLERANFSKMKLRVPCLDSFESITASALKREMIRHIHLDIELPRYTSTCCSKKRSPPVRISPIVSDAIWKLFRILSTWKRTQNDLALEINVYSPSDCEHWFKDLQLSSDTVEGDEDAMWYVSRAQSSYHDPQHGWVHGQRVKNPPRSAILRLYRPIQLAFQEALPRVEAVTHLIIRRQLRRCILPSGIGRLINTVNRVERLTYESWAPYDDIEREFLDRGLSFLLWDILPGSLDEMIVFEDSPRFYDALSKKRPPAHQPVFGFFDPREGLGATFALKTRHLRSLALSFLVDAEELFWYCRSTWTWPKLQSLALTSRLLEDHKDEDGDKRGQLESVLCRASVLIGQMPKIHTLVIWNGGKGHASAFIYRVDQNGASVTWRGTWCLDSPPVVKAWRRAVSGKRFQFTQEHIGEVIRSHGDAIHHLQLPCRVIDPASLWQIRTEEP